MTARHRPITLVLICLFFLTLGFFSRELLAAPYYEGKVLKIIVGSEPGGSYDARPDFLQNTFPGISRETDPHRREHARGRRCSCRQSHYNIAKPDGLTIGTIQRGLPFSQLLKQKGLRLTEEVLLGGVRGLEATVLGIRSDLPYKTFEDLRKTKDPIYLACSGTTSKDYHFQRF